MATDNTTLNTGTGGDTVRTVAKTVNSPAKTQAVLVDIGGGADGSAETILTAGTQTKAASLPVTPASDLANIEPAGSPITGASMPAGGSGLTGWLSAIWLKLSNTLAVSVSSLPLPTGAAQETGGNLASIAANGATAANQATGNTTLASILTKLGSVVLSAGSAIIGKVGLDQTTPGTTNGVVVNSSVLPTGAATSALQSSIVTALGSPLQAGGNVALNAGANVIGYAGSLNFQTAPVVPNLSASYASGALVGTAGTAGSGSAILTVPVFRTTTQASATLSQILFGWTGSETVNLTAYIFNKAPTTTGLTDTATPTFLAADLQHLVCAPITTTLAAPPAGSVKVFAATSLSLSVQNRDTTVTTNLYVVIVADAAITGAASGDLFFTLSGVND